MAGTGGPRDIGGAAGRHLQAPYRPVRRRFHMTESGGRNIQPVVHMAKPIAVAGGFAYDALMTAMDRFAAMGASVAGRWLSPGLLIPGRSWVEQFYSAIRGEAFFPAHAAYMQAQLAASRAPLLTALGEFRGPYRYRGGEWDSIYASWRTDPAISGEVGIVGSTRPNLEIRDNMPKDMLDSGQELWMIHERQMRTIASFLRSQRGVVMHRAGAGFTPWGDFENDNRNGSHWSFLPARDAERSPTADALREMRATLPGTRALEGYFAEDIVRDIFGIDGQPVNDHVWLPLLDIAARAVAHEVDGELEMRKHPAPMTRLEAVARQIEELFLPTKYSGQPGPGGRARAYFGWTSVELLLRLTLYHDAKFKAWDAAYRLACGTAEATSPTLHNPRFGVQYDPVVKGKVSSVPEIHILVATSGTGKTTLAKALTNKKIGVATSLIPVFAWSEGDLERSEERGIVGEDSEVLIDAERGRAMLNAGEFIATEQAYGKVYGVRRQDVLWALSRGGRAVLVAGKEIAEKLKYAANETTEFESLGIGIKPRVRDHLITAAASTICRRLARREAEGGRAAQDRVGPALVIRQHLLDRKDSFSNPTPFKNDQDIDVTDDGALRTLAHKFRDNVLNPMTTRDEADAARAEARQGQWVGVQNRSVLARIALAELVDELGRTANGKITETGQGLLGKLMFEMFRLQSPDGRQPLSLLDLACVEEVRAHTHDTYLAGLRGFNLGLFTDLEIPGGEARIAELESRVAKLMTRHGEHSGVVIAYKALLHDIAKLAYPSMEHGDKGQTVVYPRSFGHAHDVISAELIKRHGLLNDCPFPPLDPKPGDDAVVTAEKVAQRREIARLAIKYHHAIGGQFQAGYTRQIFVEMLRDPEVRAALCREAQEVEVVSRPAAQALLDDLTELAIADIGSKGFLSLTRANHYFEVRDQVLAEIAPAKGDSVAYAKAIDRLTAVASSSAMYRERLRVLAATTHLDAEKIELVDCYPDGAKHYIYEEAVVEAERRAQNEFGVQPEDLAAAEQDSHRGYYVYVSTFELAKPERKPEAGSARLNPMVVKLGALNGNLVQQLQADKVIGEADSIDMMFVDREFCPPRLYRTKIDGDGKKVYDTDGRLIQLPFTKELRRVLKAQGTSCKVEHVRTREDGSEVYQVVGAEMVTVNGKDGKSEERSAIEIVVPKKGKTADFDPVSEEHAPRRRAYLVFNGVSISDLERSK